MDNSWSNINLKVLKQAAEGVLGLAEQSPKVEERSSWWPLFLLPGYT